MEWGDPSVLENTSYTIGIYRTPIDILIDFPAICISHLNFRVDVIKKEERESFMFSYRS